jgi:hypothetical protein
VPDSQRRVGAGAKLVKDRLILDLLAEDSWLNVYAGKFEVRPPGAPTTEAVHGA